MKGVVGQARSGHIDSCFLGRVSRPLSVSFEMQVSLNRAPKQQASATTTQGDDAPHWRRREKHPPPQSPPKPPKSKAQGCGTAKVNKGQEVMLLGGHGVMLCGRRAIVGERTLSGGPAGNPCAQC